MLEALFVAAAKAPPAATAVTNNGGDWNWVVPVATLILGFGLKWLQDHVTEKRRRLHDKELRREQRYDQLRIRRLEAERANLLALQPLAVRFVRAATVAASEKRRSFEIGRPWNQARSTDEADAELRKSALELIPLHARIHTPEVSVPLNNVVNLITTAFQAGGAAAFEDIWAGVNPANNELHRVMGLVIKQLEDENQQLGDPPAG
ncbi:hypothetical protein C1922_08335 [Stenotrophomonas sp. ZAC14D2_NAIMI4_7]|uniref:hypothetical protein n=1 Tax=Stenotrophomonas sp. ZAC14D2_NAIMI4_7 TaxID=2072405 RepID=UPI000D54228E|nr:hypothetical protein [Stenotrophomonas sp. ZAC14D2_NAIMI4_7]AWH17312.1 hypothetical protein C1922_08335 [Stenotrophomonas sp. ZAC14D2_NAIMI4_7]